jgi:hypothetical protein
MTMVTIGEPPTTRRVRRKILIGRHLYVVELTTSGLTLREYGHRFTLTLPWASALHTAERLAGEETWRQRALARAASNARRGRPRGLLAGLAP